jgi:protocatechuate 3,4-dioxygenase alpha subunit
MPEATAATASQTIGPYWHLIEDTSWADLTRFGASGDKIILTGTIRDGDGQPCAGACVEIWQSDPPSSDTFPGFGRSNTDASGTYRFVTVRPGPVPGRGNTQQAPHIAIRILSRGLMGALVTRAYFQGEALNESDPLLLSIDDPAQRATLIARPDGSATWRLDIRLQGEGETVFLDV